jgi:hypothetical protein
MNMFRDLIKTCVSLGGRDAQCLSSTFNLITPSLDVSDFFPRLLCSRHSKKKYRATTSMGTFALQRGSAADTRQGACNSSDVVALVGVDSVGNHKITQLKHIEIVLNNWSSTERVRILDRDPRPAAIKLWA